MSNRRRYKKGSISTICTMLIILGLGYAAFIAKNKGIISFDNMQLLINDSPNTKPSLNNNIPHTNDFSGYGVELLTTQSLNQATLVMDDFARDGYAAFVLSSKTKEMVWYKVRLGPYTHESEALKIQSQIVRRYPNNPHVRNSLIIYKSN